MDTSILARNDSWKRRKTKITQSFSMNIHLIYIWYCQDWWGGIQSGTGWSDRSNTKTDNFFWKAFECFFAFNYHGSQVFPVIIEILQSNVMFPSFFSLYYWRPYTAERFEDFWQHISVGCCWNCLQITKQHRGKPSISWEEGRLFDYGTH